MVKRTLTEDSCSNFRDRKRPLKSPTARTSHWLDEVSFSDDADSEYEQEEYCASSVGSNDLFNEVIVLDDDDDDEAESPFSKVDTSGSHDDITGDEPQETKTEIVLFRSKTVVDNQCSEVKLTAEEWNWWLEYGSMIVDNNGFLLGEFRRLDEELYVSITANN